MSTKLQAACIGWLFISLGHTLSDWQSHPQVRSLPSLANTCAKVGWYQGSGFFLVAALMNYNWAQNPEVLRLPVNRAIAALLTVIVGVSSGWYFKKGVRPNGVVTALMGAVQAWAMWV